MISLTSLGLITFCLYTFSHGNLSSNETISERPSETASVNRRYVLFTKVLSSGERPLQVDTKENLVTVDHQVSSAVISQIFSGLPRSCDEKQTIPSSEHIFAIATTSTHILADDFYPKTYLKGTDSMLLLVLGPLDPLEITTVQNHLKDAGIKAIAIKVPEDDLAIRKLELLSSLVEFRKYDQGQAKYYTLVEHDVFIPSIVAFQNLLAQYNSIESHLIADESFRNIESHTPITLTSPLIDRIFSSDQTWKKCLEVAKLHTSSNAKISHCVAIAQGLSGTQAKFDGESLIAREVAGSAIGLLESGRRPLAYRPLQIHGPEGFQTDLFRDLLTGQAGVNTSELLTRYIFWENDTIKWIYTHGCSMVHYPEGITEKALRMTEVTWDRTPEETPAHDAPYYRALSTTKVSYLLHSITSHYERVTDGNDSKPTRWFSMIYRSNAGVDIQIDWVTS